MPTPPFFAKRMLKWFIAESIYHEVEGDLQELFEDRLESDGVHKARWLYIKDALFSIRNLKLRRIQNNFNQLVMYKNYLKIAFRNLLKHKGYSFINIFGLALGMASCLLILLFVNNELDFDGFHEKKANLYRLDEVQTFGSVSSQKVALSMYPMGPNLVTDYSEITNFTRYWTMGKTLARKEDKQYYIDNISRVDTSFFEMFDFKLIDGIKSDLFNEPSDMVMSQSTARMIFGNENPVGKTLRVTGDDIQVTVTGVFEDVPDHSHLQFDALISTKFWDDENRRSRWGSNYLNTYLELGNNVDIEALEGKFDDFLVRHMGSEDVLDYYELFLQPLTEVHLGSMDITHDYNNHKKFARSSVNIFLMLAFFVLLIASINFMNLSTARAATRGREIGVRKSIGAIKGQITGQFLAESTLFTVIALILAVGLCFLALEPLNNIIDRELSMSLYLEPLNLVVILATTILIGLLSGVYPALVMSGFNPVLALKGSGLSGSKSIFRNVLVVFQYAIAIAIIIGTILATRQLDYMQNLDLGFEKDLVVTMDMYGDTNEKYDLLRSELMNQSNVTDVTATTQRLGNNLHQTSMTYDADTARINGSSSFVVVDVNFMDFYEMDILEGRGLSKDYAEDNNGRSFVVNQTLAKEIASTVSGDVVGTPFHFGGTDTLGTIVGVVKDFNYNKLNLRVEPLFMSRQPWGWSEVNVKLKGGDLQAGLRDIEQVWTTLFPQRPFEYQFLDDHIGEMYQSEQQLTRVISILSVLAIIIASLGLFGLASFTVRQRLKEMGIRKVLGATVSQIVMILSKKFTLLVLIAFAIAAPLTYYLMDEWMAGYAYSVGIGAGIFLVVGIGSWLIALVTVSAQSFRVAKSNPVETLRIE